MNMTLERFLPEFSSGRCVRAEDFLGAHCARGGVVFRLWAPNAVRVGLAGDFNGWNPDADPMTPRDGGVWELFLPGLPAGSTRGPCSSKNSGRSASRASTWKAADAAPRAPSPAIAGR